MDTQDRSRQRSKHHHHHPGGTVTPVPPTPPEPVKVGLCRIVRFQNPDGTFIPAIVTGVNSDGSVNLHLFPNVKTQSWMQTFVTSVIEGDTPGQWSWPPRS